MVKGPRRVRRNAPLFLTPNCLRRSLFFANPLRHYLFGDTRAPRRFDFERQMGRDLLLPPNKQVNNRAANLHEAFPNDQTRCCNENILGTGSFAFCPCSAPMHAPMNTVME